MHVCVLWHALASCGLAYRLCTGESSRSSLVLLWIACMAACVFWELLLVLMTAVWAILFVAGARWKQV